MSLAARTKQWTARNLQKLFAQRDPVPTFARSRPCTRAQKWKPGNVDKDINLLSLAVSVLF